MALRPRDDVGAALIESIERFARRLDARATDRAHHIDPAIRAEAAELGLFGLSLPEEHGGFGFSLRDCCVAVAALAVHDRAVATIIGLHLGLGTRALVAWGSPAQKAAWLPDLAAGRRIAAFATTEPEAGSDLTAIATRAVPDGEGLRVDGSKIYVTNGGFADLYTISAATPDFGGRRGHSILVIQRDDPGVVVGPEEDKLGLRASSTTSLHLDGVRVGMDRVLGEPGAGRAQLGHVLARGRTLMAAGCVGIVRAAEALARRHVAVRQQFGKPLAELDVVRAQLADMAALRRAAEAVVERVDVPEEEELVARSLVAKLFASEVAWEVADLGVQLHGGAGFIEETGAAILLRDARITRIFEGANDVLRLHLGTIEAAGRKRPATGVALADAFGAEIEAERQELGRRWGVRLARQPRRLHRLGSLAMWREAVDALALDPETPAALLQWFVAMARARVRAVPDVDAADLAEVSG